MSTNINAKANLIWEVATKLVGVYKPHEYGKVILPMTVLKRFDDILKPTKEKVLEKYEEVKNFEVKEPFLTEASGYIFEELVRKFSESYDEEAGAHFTARDIIYLMTDLLVAEERDVLINENKVKTIYDMAMGTSQMLSCMTDRLKQLNENVNVACYGQELNPETYAIARADMLIKGGDADNFKQGNTLDDDKFKGYEMNILNETRQLKYSTQNENSIDIVLLLNGIPLVALELKNQITGQNSENAQKQFMYDRDPRELIFKFNSRIIVYFAVDHYDVKMTTKLAGPNTRYLPFNQGSNGAGNVGGAGNPTNTNCLYGR